MVCIRNQPSKNTCHLTRLSLPVCLLFQEPEGGISIPASAIEHDGNEKARAKWNAMEFAENYGLKLIGSNYFMTEIEK